MPDLSATLRPPIAVHAPGASRDATPALPRHVRRGVWAGLFVCAATAALALSQTAARVPYFAGDVRVTRAVQSADLHLLAWPLRALNALGFEPIVVIAYGSVLLALLLAGRRWAAVSGMFGVLGASGINQLVKQLVGRPRPSLHLVHVEQFIRNPSFPAGHVLNFTVFAGFLCCLLWLHTRPSWRRGALLTALLAAILLMGLARIQSGEHWPSDVLGGYLLGAAWLSLIVLLYDWGQRRRLFAPNHGGTARSGFGLIALFAVGVAALPATAAFAAPVATDSLSASTEPPWNPPSVLARRRGWEQAVLLPGRAISLPLVGLGRACEYALLQIEQRPRWSNALMNHEGSAGNGLSLGTAHLGDRTGLGGTLGIHTNLLHGARSSRLAAEYSGTLNRYGRTLLTWTGRPLSVQFGEEWRPQERFYGTGNESPESDAADYALGDEFLRAGLAWASNRERDPRRTRAEFGIWGGPRSTVMRTGREAGVTSYEQRFPLLAAATLDRRTERLVYGARLLRDGRGGAPHWSRGWRTLLSAERFGAPVRTLALHSGSRTAADFTRVQAEAEIGASFMRDPRTVRLLVRTSDIAAGAHADRMLPSDLSTLGGRAGLGGFIPGRFHDLDMLLTRLDYVFPLQRSFEMDLHSEWGAVYPDVWRDAALRTLHNSFGFSLRSRSNRSPSGAIGFDFCREGARLRFSLGGTE